MDLQNSIAIVTGANRGIGKVIVETLLDKGAAKVYAAVRNPDSAQPLVDAHGGKVVALEVDMSKPDTITKAAQAASDVNIVVNNAGILNLASPLDDHAIETFQEELDVNVFGFLRMAQAFAPVLKANGGGALVQLNSIASVKCFADFSTYCASKAAAYSFTQALREKLTEQNTLVVSVHPGPIATDMAIHAGFTDMADSPQTVADGIIEALTSETFHVFPDAMAKQINELYEAFGTNIVEANLMEG